MRIYLIFDLINVNGTQLHTCLILVIQLWATKMDIVLFLSSLILRKSGGISVCKVLMPIKYSAGIQYLYQGEINVCKALMSIKYSAGKE